MSQHSNGRLHTSFLVAGFFLAPYVMAHETLNGVDKIPLTERKVELATDAHHELCIELNAMNLLHYEFHSDDVLEFNLHYHDGQKLLFPVFPEMRSGHRDIYKPTYENTFCLMWANESTKTVILRYTFEVS